MCSFYPFVELFVLVLALELYGAALQKSKTFRTQILRTTHTAKDLSDPSNSLFDIPFPFTGRLPEDRFTSLTSDPVSAVPIFKFMGRSEFSPFIEKLKAHPVGEAQPFNVYGTKGYGKSHILATAVVHLQSVENQRVVFLPQCHDLATQNTLEYIRAALLLAFADDDDTALRILTCPDEASLVTLANTKKFILVADQVNSVEESSKIDADKKRDVKRLLDQLAINDRLIIRGFSASNQTAIQFVVTQRSERDAAWFKGFSDEVESFLIPSRLLVSVFHM